MLRRPALLRGWQAAAGRCRCGGHISLPLPSAAAADGAAIFFLRRLLLSRRGCTAVQAKFVNGKPDKIEVKYVMRSSFEWDRFMR